MRSRQSQQPGLALWLLLMLAIATPLAAQQENNAGTRDWLGEMSKAFHSLNYDLSFVYIRNQQVESMRLIHAVDNGVERERLIHLDGQVREVIRDKDTVTCYFDNAPPVVLDEVSTQNPITDTLVRQILEGKGSYQLEYLGSDRIADRTAHLVRVASRDRYRYDYRFWMDEETGMLLRFEVLGNDGEVREQIVVVSLQLFEEVPELALVSPLAGRYVDLPGARVIGARTRPDAGVQPDPYWKMNWLPDGFELRSSGVVPNRKEGDTYSFLFSDGIASISVFINTFESGARDPKSRLMSRGGTTVYDLVALDHSITVVGDIPESTARKIARAVNRSK